MRNREVILREYVREKEDRNTFNVDSDGEAQMV